MVVSAHSVRVLGCWNNRGLISASIGYMNWKANREEKILSRDRDAEILSSKHHEQLQDLKYRLTFLEASVVALKDH